MKIDFETADAIRFWFMIAIAIVFCVVAGRIVGQVAPPLVLAGMGGVVLALVSFMFPKAGLAIVVFSMIFSPRVESGGLGHAGRVQHGSAIFKLNDFLLIIAVVAWMARSAVLKGKAFLVQTPLNVPILAFGAICMISTAFGILRGDLRSPTRPFFYVLKYVEYHLLFFMAVNVCDQKEDIRRFLRYMWLTAMAVTVFGYTQIPAGQRVHAPFDTAIGADQEASEPNTFGGYYLVIVGLMLGFFTQNTGNFTMAMLLSLVFIVPPFMLTESRSSYIGLVAAMTFHMIATNRRRLVLLFGIGMMFMTVAGVPRLRDAVTERVAVTFKSRGGGTGTYNIGGRKVLVEGSAQARLENWQFVVTKAIVKRPILGYGVTGVGLVDAYYPLLLGETGFTGFLCFLWIMWRIASCAWFVFRRSKDADAKALALGIVTAQIGLLTHAVAANTFILVRVMEPFWFAVALLARVYLWTKEEVQGEDDSDSWQRRQRELSPLSGRLAA